jgi:hypothetical protein
MTTLTDFNTMTFEQKCDVITLGAAYLMHRTIGETKVFLYYVDGFYIEVFYSSKSAKVLMMNGFENPIGLDPYLDIISLGSLDGIVEKSV